MVSASPPKYSKLSRLRSITVAAALIFAAVMHGFSALRWREAGLPTGMSLALVVYTIGDLTAAYGLLRRRYWARCMTLAIAVVTILQIAATALLMATSDIAAPLCTTAQVQSGVIQVLACGGLALLMSGSSMRAAFEERVDGPWRFDTRVAKLLRLAVMGSIGVTPMVFWMAAHAVYATSDLGRWISLVAGLSMVLSILTIIRGRTIGLPMLAVSAMGAATGAILTVASLDTNPAFAGQHDYWTRTVAAAAAIAPGVVLATIVFAACVPKLIRLVREAD